MLNHLKSHLKGKVLILGVGNTMRSDDGIGAILAARIKDKVPFLVWEVGISPENYLGKVVKEKPDTILVLDAVDFRGKPGEFKILEAEDLKTANLFFTHNVTLSLLINYLQSNLKVDIIILIIQPKTVVFGDRLSSEVTETLNKLESWFYGTGKERRCRM